MSSEISVRKVSGKKELKDFILFPWGIYRGKKPYPYPQWAPPLIMSEKELFDEKKNPFYAHADQANFLAYRNGKLVGRISAIQDRNYISFQQDNACFFGFFECFEDEEATKALFSEAEAWARGKKADRILGPMNPSTGHIMGILKDSYDLPPMVQMGYNPPYYNDLITNQGYGKEKDLFCYTMDADSLPLSEKMKRVSSIALKRNNITLRPVNMKKFREEVELIRELYNSGWEKNWGFVPWTPEEFDLLARDLKMIAEPALVLMAFAGEKLAGISIPLPDVNQIFLKMNGRLFPFGIFKLLLGSKKINRLRVAILGVGKEYHNKGIDAIFACETYRKGVELGYRVAEFSWILEDNYPLVNMLETWGAKRYRAYRVYCKKL